MSDAFSRNSPFSILIPVFNETDALRFSMHYMSRMGLSPIYVLDRKGSGNTEAILTGSGLPWAAYENDRPFIENGYASLADQSPTDWILRLDCDEVPSPELLAFCRDFIEAGRCGTVGFERHQLLWRDGRFLTATTDRFSPPNQRQWRLFDRRKVEFDRRIHTPGIHVATGVPAPPQAEIYHLSWVFLSWQDRVAKAARYDAHGQPEANRNNQLFPVEDVHWQELDRPFLRDGYVEWVRASNFVARDPASIGATDETA